LTNVAGGGGLAAVTAATVQDAVLAAEAAEGVVMNRLKPLGG